MHSCHLILPNHHTLTCGTIPNGKCMLCGAMFGWLCAQCLRAWVLIGVGLLCFAVEVHQRQCIAQPLVTLKAWWTSCFCILRPPPPSGEQ